MCLTQGGGGHRLTCLELFFIDDLMQSERVSQSKFTPDLKVITRIKREVGVFFVLKALITRIATAP